MSPLYCDCDFGGSKDPARECECEKHIRELEAELAETRKFLEWAPKSVWTSADQAWYEWAHARLASDAKRIRELEDAEQTCKAANESQRTTIATLEAELADGYACHVAAHAFLKERSVILEERADRAEVRAEKAEAEVERLKARCREPEEVVLGLRPAIFNPQTAQVEGGGRDSGAPLSGDVPPKTPRGDEDGTAAANPAACSCTVYGFPHNHDDDREPLDRECGT